MEPFFETSNLPKHDILDVTMSYLIEPTGTKSDAIIF